MRRGYEVPARARRHPTGARRGSPGTFDTVVVAAAVAIALVTGAWLVVAGGAALVGALRSPRVAAAVLVLGGAAVVRADEAWDGLRPDALGPFDGWATVTGDPQAFPGATRVVVSVEGERYETWVRGRIRRRRADGWEAGELLRLAGERVPLDPERRVRVAAQP